MKYIIALIALPIYIFLGLFVVFVNMVLEGAKTVCATFDLWWKTFVEEV